MDFYIDIVDACNLRCPTCSRGRRELESSSEQMTEDRLERILEKAKKEAPVENIHLYNATEPTLHPNLPRMIRRASNYGRVWISTNASVLGVDWNGIYREDLYSLGISVSGWEQKTHERGHPGSNLDVVKNAIRTLGDLKRWDYRKTPLFQLYYHRYRYNLAEEKPMRKFAKENGFKVFSAWAIVMDYFPVESDCECIIGNREARKLLEGKKVSQCYTLENIISIDCCGNVYLCGHGATVPNLCSFLDTPLTRIQEIRRIHPLCLDCMGSGFAHYGDRDELMKYLFSKRAGFTLKYWGEFWRNWLWSRLRWLKLK